MGTTKAFLGKGSKSMEGDRDAVHHREGVGLGIQPYSLFPDEEEILLEPEKRFRVAGVILSSALTIINLEMLDTSLSVPEVFGVVVQMKKERSTISLFFLFFSFSWK